jgi:3-phenylpropionate/trans-cinnamate dioxygenase ferredoxin subunit
MHTNRNWVKVAESTAELGLAPGKVVEADANGKTLCLAQHNEEVFAFAQKCPHAGGHFVNGSIDLSGNVTCPLHRYKFCVKNGRNVTGEGYHLKHWPVEIRNDGVFVGLEISAWSLF